MRSGQGGAKETSTLGWVGFVCQENQVAKIAAAADGAARKRSRVTAVQRLVCMGPPKIVFHTTSQHLKTTVPLALSLYQVSFHRHCANSRLNRRAHGDGPSLGCGLGGKPSQLTRQLSRKFVRDRKSSIVTRRGPERVFFFWCCEVL